MPRICFSSPEADYWNEVTGEGTSTFDVCVHCLKDGDTADTLGLTDKGYNGDPIPSYAEAELTGSEPCDIDELEYDCEVCGCRLTSENYYE
jgi:hypothetical protein